MVSLFLLPSFLSLHRALPISLLLSLSLSVSRRGLSRAQPAVKLKNFRAFCGPPDESPGVHADWLDYRLGFETHQTDRKICRLHNSARLIRARVCACVRMRMHDEIRARTRAARTCTQACTRLAPAPAPSTRTPRRTPRPVAFTSCENFARVSSRSDTLLSPFFLSFFPSSFLSFFLPFPPRPCSIFYEALPPFLR